MANCPLISDTLLWLRGLRNDLLNRKSLVYLLIVAGALTVGFGFAFYVVDPSVKSPFDGMWYAWVTMTHVGYGDVVVTSMTGRLLASVLILLGIALLALCTATISAAFIGRDTDQLGRDVRLLAKETGQMKSEENQVLLELARIQERLARMEERMNNAEPPQST